MTKVETNLEIIRQTNKLKSVTEHVQPSVVAGLFSDVSCYTKKKNIVLFHFNRGRFLVIDFSRIIDLERVIGSLSKRSANRHAVWRWKLDWCRAVSWKNARSKFVRAVDNEMFHCTHISFSIWNAVAERKGHFYYTTWYYPTQNCPITE